MANDVRPIDHFYEVIVLGCGIAGLGSGQVLKSAKVNFLMLEASERVGGRIQTVDMINFKNDDKIVRVEAGAQWIHGRNNELFQLANKYKMIRPELSEEGEGDYIREDGTKFEEFFVRKIDFKIGQILEECEKFVELKQRKDIKFPSSIAEYVEKKFKTYLENLDIEEEKIQAMQLLDWHRKFQIIDNSCDYLTDISAKDWGNYSFNGESCQTHINVKNGMSAITEKICESLKEHIKFNKNVELIYWKNEQHSDRIKIVCKDGSTYFTNNVICTFPLGILKDQHLKMFNPELPLKYQEVIENIGFGTINKIFLCFNEKWWNDDWKGLQLLWSNELNDVSFYSKTQSNKFKYNFFNQNSHWTKYISGFDVVYPTPENTYLLIGWIGGKVKLY